MVMKMGVSAVLIVRKSFELKEIKSLSLYVSATSGLIRRKIGKFCDSAPDAGSSAHTLLSPLGRGCHLQVSDSPQSRSLTNLKDPAIKNRMSMKPVMPLC